MGKEAIIDKIVSDAELRANAMTGEAQAKAGDILAEAASQCKIYYDQSRADIDRLKKDAAARGETVAELDAKKLMLNAKAEILNKVFARALEKARSLDKATYKKLISGMLSEAQDGDTVTVSERESGIVTEKFIAEFAQKRGIKLKLSKEKGSFDGGIVLSGGGVDKNLTLEVEIALLRDACEAEIAKEMFADV